MTPTPTTISSQPSPSTSPQTPFKEGDIMVQIYEFLKLKPPTFSRVSKQEDPQRFMKVMEKSCKVLHCSSQRSVEFAMYQLQDVAKDWYDALEQGMQANTPPWSGGSSRRSWEDSCQRV